MFRDAHAKLRTTNEKLKREKEKSERDRDDIRAQVKERSRIEQSEDKKVSRLLNDMETFVSYANKLLNEDAMKLKQQVGDILNT